MFLWNNIPEILLKETQKIYETNKKGIVKQQPKSSDEQVGILIIHQPAAHVKQIKGRTKQRDISTVEKQLETPGPLRYFKSFCKPLVISQSSSQVISKL